MSLWHKRTLGQAAIWLVGAAGFLLAGLGGDGPAALVEDSTARRTAALFVGGALLASLALRYVTRRRGALVDERDEMIRRRSSEIALGLTAGGVFLACIALHDHFAAAGAVPVAWLWFTAWATMAASHLGQAVVALILYSGAGGRGQG